MTFELDLESGSQGGRYDKRINLMPTAFEVFIDFSRSIK